MAAIKLGTGERLGGVREQSSASETDRTGHSKWFSTRCTDSIHHAWKWCTSEPLSAQTHPISSHLFLRSLRPKCNRTLRLAFLNREQANKLLLIDSNVEPALVSSWSSLNNARNKRTTKDSNRDYFIIFTYNNYCLILFSFANYVFNVKFVVFTHFYLTCTN